MRSVSVVSWEVLTNFQRQYDHYKSEYDASGSEGKFKQPWPQLELVG